MSKGVGSQYRAFIPPVPTPWVALPFSANYQIFSGATYSQPAYRRIGDIVYLRGLVGRNTATAPANSTLATLPAGFVPTAINIFEQNCGTGRARVDVYPAGGVLHADFTFTVGTYLSLDGIFFSVLA